MELRKIKQAAKKENKSVQKIEEGIIKDNEIIVENNENITTDSIRKEHINYRNLCVTKKKDIFLYPKTIPKERGPLATEVALLLCLFLFSGDLFCNINSFEKTFMRYTAGLLLAIILQILFRLILMCEEYNHLYSRYDGNFLILIKGTFHFNTYVVGIFVLSFAYFIYYITAHGFNLANEVDILKVLIPIMVIYLLGNIFQFSAGPLNDSLWVAENNGLDYGSGMAYSFFYGYLNLVLPKTGKEDKHLKEIMQDYEDQHVIKFDVYKLFILIPKSLKCFVSLKNEYSPSIEESNSLEEKIITVAGVPNRVYKNAVYKIVLENGKRCYVAAEYATPIKTFKDVFDTRGVHSEFYDKLKKDIILQFYLTLGKVLEDKGLSDSCELIYFEDSYVDSEGQTSYYDVGKIIQARLKELKKKRD